MTSNADWTDDDTAGLVLALAKAGHEPVGRFIRDKLERHVLTYDEARAFMRAVEAATQRECDSLPRLRADARRDARAAT